MLGSPTTKFRPYPHPPGPRTRAWQLGLPQRSPYVVEGNARWHWQHSIAASTIRWGGMSAPSRGASPSAEARSPVPSASLWLRPSAVSAPHWLRLSEVVAIARALCTSLPLSELSLGPSASVSLPFAGTAADGPPRMLLFAMTFLCAPAMAE